VAIVARRLRIPYSTGLVVAGIALALVPQVPAIPLTPTLLFTAFLPPLVFEAAFSMSWPVLRTDLPVILTLATGGVLLSGGVTATGMHGLVQWEWSSAILFGALIAATDPVAVLATFKEAGVQGRLRRLVEAESLLNDGTAAVAFSVALVAATGGPVDSFRIAQEVVVQILGGVLCGVLVAGVVLGLAGRTEDHLVEITFTTVAAYGSFLLAEHWQLSGVLATLTAGLLVGHVGPLGSLSERGREAVQAFWEYAAFVANSLIFLLIGMRIAQQHFAPVVVPTLVAITVVMLGRAFAIYPCCALFASTALRVEGRHQHLLFWGGLRGALALALALGLPSVVPHHDSIVTVAFAVVAFSVFVQGLTLPPLLRRMGEIPIRRRT